MLLHYKQSHSMSTVPLSWKSVRGPTPIGKILDDEANRRQCPHGLVTASHGMTQQNVSRGHCLSWVENGFPRKHPPYLSFLSPPVHITWWMHMCRFPPVCPSICTLFQISVKRTCQSRSLLHLAETLLFQRD